MTSVDDRKKQHIDNLYHFAYNDPRVSIAQRLYSRDNLRHIKEGTYTWPTWVTTEK